MHISRREMTLAALIRADPDAVAALFTRATSGKGLSAKECSPCERHAVSFVSPDLYSRT